MPNSTKMADMGDQGRKQALDEKDGLNEIYKKCPLLHIFF